MLTSIRITLVLLLIVSGVYPLIVWGLSQAAFAHQANGSLTKDAQGKVVGSALLAQGFTKPEYFHPRPSAAGNGYDATASSGTNLGPTSDKLINGIHKKTADGKDDPSNFDGVKDLAAQYRTENSLPAGAPVPVDAVTRSASGLDPDISVANAKVQAARVAKARGVGGEEIDRLVDANTQGRDLGLFGEPRVNVLQLNLALDKQYPKAAK
ncbi:K(+)-transporting ATPase subunit C [Capsulimonas corticalis]|uniref:K(+)-transporting ATPase subunit C n=1 Tax=Capsulimonas corticalis TaxID=2219043 RepID=UPI000E64B970